MFGLLNIDKPLGLTSRDVVNRVQRLVRPDKAGHAGTLVEISDISGGKGKFFEHIRKAAANWDGGDPVRAVRP